jgi:hypothetical protein
VTNSHNLLLDLLIHNGVPIGLLTAGLLTLWFVRRVQACRSGAHWAVLAGVGMVFAHCMVEFPLDYVYFLLPIGLMMGALHGLEDGVADLPSEAPTGRSVGRAVFGAWVLGLCAMLVWIGVEYLKVESATRQLRFVLLGVGVDKVPDAPEPDAWLIDQPREYHRFLLMRAQPGMSDADLDFMRRTVTRATHPNAVLRLALALGLNGRPQEATEWLLRICKLHPVRRCNEGRDSWAAAQLQWPVLQAIPYPATPPELLR